MDTPEEATRVKEIKRLLDRLLLVQPSAAAILQPGGNAYPQQWPDEAMHGPRDGDGGEQMRPQSVMGPWLFVLATALNTIVAAVLAVLITLGVVRQGPGQDAALAALPPAAASDAQTASTAAAEVPASEKRAQMLSLVPTVVMRPIGSPDAPLRLQAMTPAKLPLQIQPAEAQRETFLLVLAGLPAKAVLSGAERIGSDTWLLGPDAADRLELTVPEWSTSLLEIDIELRRTSGAIAAHTKAWIAVPPPRTATMPERLDPAAVAELVRKADQHLGRGDVVGARALYQRAVEMGSGPAALALGATFDPNRLWSLGVFGMVGNQERARQWYQRADRLGHPDAKARLKTLGN
jgi:TPR repeat protein